MGRKGGKRFDKKNAISFHVVARSGFDPASQDPNASKFLLQPRSLKHLPDDFPRDLIFQEGEDVNEDYYLEEEARKAELEEAANDPTLFPHEYNYEAHLKPIGMGTFVPAPHAAVDPEKDVRTQEEKKHEEEIFAELGEELPKKLKYREPRTKNKKVTKDFLLSLEDDDEDELVWDPLEDNFIDIAMTGKKSSTDEKGAEIDEYDDEKGTIVEEEYYEDEEEYEECEGEEEEEGDENEDENEEEDEEEEDESQPKSKSKQRRRDDVDDEDELYGSGGQDEDEEEDEDEDTINGRHKRLIDTQFDRMLEEYDDDELGELDESDPSLQGSIDVAADVIDANYDGVIEDFVTQRDREYQQNRGDVNELTTVHITTTQQIDRLENDVEVLAEEMDVTILNEKLDNMFPRPVRDNWDAESIVSTYSNLENRPTMIAIPKKEKLIHLSNKTGIPLGIIPTRPTRKQREAAAAAVIPEHDDDNVDDDVDETDPSTSGTNLGRARDTLETPAEKKARKQAVKAARREQRQNKKQLKQMYSSELSHQAAIDAAQKRNNPPAKKIQ